jgi:hypothetical protein
MQNGAKAPFCMALEGRDYSFTKSFHSIEGWMPEFRWYLPES